MSHNTQPATKVDTLTDFSSDITAKYRKLYCIGGTQVVFEDNENQTVTVLAADYAAVNNQGIYVTKIKSTTDCTKIYASV